MPKQRRDKMKNTVMILLGSLILAGCMLDDSYTADYYNGDADAYDSMTTGYNRDFNQKNGVVA